MSERMDFADGKYTVINDNGKLTALRYGEPWRDLAGDNLIYWMLTEALAMKTQRDALLKGYRKMKNVAASYSNFCDDNGTRRRLEREFDAADAIVRAAIKAVEENT